MKELSKIHPGFYRYTSKPKFDYIINTTINGFDKHIEYEADYGWLKNGKTRITNKKDNKYRVPAVGYEDDQLGVFNHRWRRWSNYLCGKNAYQST